MSLAPLVLWLRRVRVDRVQLAVLGVAVFATAFLAAAGPLLAVRASADALRAELAHANPAERNLVVSTAQVLQVDPLTDQLASETDRDGRNVRRCAPAGRRSGPAPRLAR